MTRTCSLLLALLLLLVEVASARGQGSTSLTLGGTGAPVTVLADRLEQVGADNLLIATGNVEVTRGTARLTADRVEINSVTGDAVAQGRVVFYDGETQLTAQRIEYNFRTGTGVVYQADARAAPYYRLSGERMERLGESLYRVRRGAFTTCEDEPPLWSFRFGSGTADVEDFVYGTNASFWVKNVPLIPFFPFFAAAIRRERQTGFLFPKVGNSSSKGFFAELPFYWAISDSQDATLALDVYSKRGVGATGEYRYLLSEGQRGSLSGFYLSETERNGADRGVGTIRHRWLIAPGFTFNADVNGVTDDKVLSEFGDRLHQRSSQRVESNVFLARAWPTWNAVADLFWYQDLTTRRPVELHRLPELSALGVRQPAPAIPGLLYEADAGLVRFVREVGSDGTRLDLHPRLSRPISPGGLFTVAPFVGGRLTAYDRTVTGTRNSRGGIQIETTADEARVRRLVEAGTDLELTASRVYPVGGWGGFDSLLHSVEPRVNYLFITGSDKDRLPLWTEGVDRISETSRIEYSLINRLRAKTVAPADTEPVRLEVIRLALGHSYDLRRDTPGGIIADLIVQPAERIRFRGDVRYDVAAGSIDTANTDISLTTRYILASVGTRYSDPGKISFLQGTLTSEVSRYLTARLTTNTDMRTGTFVENRFGIDLRFQCWALTVDYVSRHRRDDEVRFALNLLGVGGPATTAVGLGALESSKQR
jgi:LPS-assembly protein